MADRAKTEAFEAAFARTKRHEQGYTASGPTYMGIDRRWWSKWPGWVYVDAWLAGKISEQSRDTMTAPSVRKFYRDNFWDRINGESLAAIDPGLAATVFDFAVNSDPVDAARALQVALNVMYRPASGRSILKPDGKIGENTLGALRVALDTVVGGDKRNSRTILLVHYFGARYNHMMACPDFKKWPGWFIRLAREAVHATGSEP